MTQPISIFWLRRDLRLEDNAGLYHALKSGTPVLPLFIFDKDILNQLEDKKDGRVDFIHQEITRLNNELKALGSSILIKHGKPYKIWEELLNEHNLEQVFINRDYEPSAIKRDEEIEKLLSTKGVKFNTYKDQCIFEKDEVLKDDGTPYTVYTPYSKKWKAKVNDFYLKAYPTEKYFSNFHKSAPLPIPSLADIGFEPSGLDFPPKEVSKELIKNYAQKRDIPSVKGTSRLSLHYRFGTVSIREKMRKSKDLSEKYYNELIWREFYMQILAHFPHVVKGAFKPAYDAIVWRNNEEEFKKWCDGKTGYPIVDAGMRELNQTGYMHNRVRMIVASFLTKDLLIDWRWGEAYFAEKLLDFELASNNGGWQWAAGSGVDAAPYFRVFNPWLQQKKFDPNLIYIRKWLPEYGSSKYPQPIVDHDFARKRCLEAYKVALDKDK